jgi:hypothetical protein
MKKTIHALFSALLALTLLSDAHAAVESINVQTFNPSTSDRFVVLEDGFRPESPRKNLLYFGANYNFFNDPLPVLDATQTVVLGHLIDNIQTIDLFAGIKLSNNFGLFFGAPIHTVRFPATFNGAASAIVGDKNAMGDFKIMGKIRLSDDASNTHIALIPEVHLPTGGTEFLVSDASPYLGVRFTLERQFEAWTMVLNLGYVSAANAIYTPVGFTPINYRNRLITGIGGYLPFSDELGMSVEVNSINMIPFNSSINPNDAYAGLRWAPVPELAFTAGGSVGRIGGALGSTYRMIAGVRYTLGEDTPQSAVPLSK